MADKQRIEFDDFIRFIIRKVMMVLLGVLLLVAAGMLAMPQYRVYEQRLAGEAKLREAEFSKQIQEMDAKGKLAASKMLADAEVERAKGVAEANKIIGTSLKDNPDYLTWLWVEKVADNGNGIIYIPTEGGMPILEAGRGLNRRTPEPKKADRK